ncbi:MAG TPA: hypothetical protein VKB27_20365 [Gammaproteobacteria bacterium]|nr:hypothetical protein [Gammaproteobacteria bacterium]
MTTVLIAVPLFLLAVAGLGLGLILRRKPPCGSCGNCAACLMRRAGS